MISKRHLRKLGFRILIINVVFLCVKLFVEHNEDGQLIDSTTVFYYVTTFILFLTAWEINDLLLKRTKWLKAKTEIGRHILILLFTIIPVMVLSAVIYYLGAFEFDSVCQIVKGRDKWDVFKLDMFRALGIVVVFSSFNQFYSVYQDKKKLELSVLELQKAMTESQFSSLKNQISPHFLFNSLNTLTSLMYEDRDLASDFVSRLAASYRYILDNREKDLTLLANEIQFLDTFIFMIKVRHGEAIKVNVEVEDDLHNKYIPTLALQMLVENSLKHNYYSKENPIHIEVYEEDNYLVISNNLKLRKDEGNSTKLGLGNIKKRYSYYTKREVMIHQNRWLFIVKIPLLKNKNAIEVIDNK